MEFQNYEYGAFEGLEKKLKNAQNRLKSSRKASEEAGISAFEEIPELDFGQYYGLAVQHSKEKADAEQKEKQAEKRLRLAEKRLKAAQSYDLGKRLERSTWVGFFKKVVECAQN